MTRIEPDWLLQPRLLIVFIYVRTRNRRRCDASFHRNGVFQTLALSRLRNLDGFKALPER